MKGKLINKKGKWFVQYLEAQDAKYMCSQMTTVLELPLHPTNIAGVELMWEPEEDVAYKNVEFEIDMCIGMSYAKLIQPKSKEQIIEEYLINNTKNFGNVKQSKEETWDDIIKVYCNHVGINYKSMSEGDSEFWIWIKQNYFSPKKK